MNSNRMKISEFAQVTGIARRNLLFYDKIGLLSPAMIDENNKYRYYTYHQIDTANVITVLREIGMPLKEIKEYLYRRSPEKLIYLLETQKRIVQEKIKMLIQISDMMDTRIDLIEKGLSADINIDSISLKECEETPIFLGPELPADSHILAGWDYLIDFYEFCRENRVIRGLPTGTIINHADLIQGNFTRPSRYYYRSVSGSSYPNNAEKPKGLYVIGQEHTEYAKSYNLYTRLYSYIEETGLKICGHAYEEYLLDEISTTDPMQYLLQVAIHVQK
ncbi:MAG: MerR family transcriptional regulator [Clostridiaceae bacterium]|nr:MerR family transcriptional regulator [Clostridiaceae bacterium]